MREDNNLIRRAIRIKQLQTYDDAGRVLSTALVHALHNMSRIKYSALLPWSEFDQGSSEFCFTSSIVMDNNSDKIIMCSYSLH